MDIQNDPNATPGASYASCNVVEAWKCGQTPNGPQPVKVAEVFRDVTIITRGDCTPNNEPNALIDTSLYPRMQQTGPKSYVTDVFPGDTVEFELSASDFDYNNISGALVPQQIEFRAEGLQASRPYNSGVGCDGVVPCAEFHPVAPQTGYSKALNNNIRFFWVPDCQHLNVQGNYCSPINTFYFALRMQDNGCPAPRISLNTVIVNVQIGDPSPIKFGCLKPNANGDALLDWNRSEQDSALEFNYYLIMGSSGARNGTYDTLQRIYDIDSLSTIINASGGYKHFYIVKSTGKCDFFSQPSDTLSLMNMSLTATPPGNSEIADLQWSPLSGGQFPWFTNGVYEIWTEAPAGSGNWVKLDETTDTKYTDQVTVCSADVNYQIRVYDTLRNCYSASNLDSAFFSDQTNKDEIVIDSVSVNANGKAEIAWQDSPSGDVVAFYLYYNDPKQGWIVVDTIPRGEPMPYEWAGSTADSRSEEFRVVSVDSCDNQSDDQLVRAHKTIYLKGYIDKCEAEARVSWNNYQGFGRDGVDRYRLLVQTTNSGVTDPWRELYVGGPNDTSYHQRNLRNNTEYCYRVQVIDTSGTVTSRSNEICRLAEVPRKSRILYVAQVTNDLGREALTLNFLVDGQADVESFDIERAQDPMGPYRRIGRVGKPTAPPYMVTYNDFGADPSRYHYFYRVSANDSCGGRDTLSNIGRNIVLHVHERSNLTNGLVWNPYQKWDGVVATYNIYRKAADETDFSLVGQVPGDDTTYVDDIKDYRDTEGNFCYYVEAVEGNNSLGIVDDNGQPYKSVSNQDCINQSAKVFMPTGFRPGSDVMKNQEFKPTLRFDDVTKYYFYVMNRWGVKVFETQDPDEGWDGTHDGEEAAAGVYIYYLQYATPGQAAREERGSFTLIR